MIATSEKKNPTLPFLRYRVVPHRQVPYLKDWPGNGTGLAGTTLSRTMTAGDSLHLFTIERFYFLIMYLPISSSF